MDKHKKEKEVLEEKIKDLEIKLKNSNSIIYDNEQKFNKLKIKYDNDVVALITDNMLDKITLEEYNKATIIYVRDFS